jgi:hypothetical protein
MPHRLDQPNDHENSRCPLKVPKEDTEGKNPKSHMRLQLFLRDIGAPKGLFG